MKLNGYIDHTILKASATQADVAKLCAEAARYGFASVCVNTCWAAFAKRELAGSPVKVCCVVGFPLGAMSTAAKAFEAAEAVRDGADEIDMVINVGFLKSGKLDEVRADIAAVKKAVGSRVLKVILETCYLDDADKKTACALALEAGADFVKTSTGFGTGGATFEDVRLMLDAVAGKAKVKASGGVKDAETAAKYVEMGVARLGTSSGIAIVEAAGGADSANGGSPARGGY
jgi:deoxyribose-phosphate aldolase